MHRFHGGEAFLHHGLHLRHALRSGNRLVALHVLAHRLHALARLRLDLVGIGLPEGFLRSGKLEVALEPGQTLFGAGAGFHHAAALHPAFHARHAVGTATRTLRMGDAEHDGAGGNKAGNDFSIQFHGVLLW